MVGNGNLTVTGTVTAVNSYAAIESSATIRASGNFICAADGTLPIYARKFILNTTPTAAKTRYALNGSGTYVDMFTADNTGLAPAVTDVRAGVVYGSATGTCAVPAAGSVSLGVPVDGGFGTAVLTPDAVWGHASRTITEGGITASDVWDYNSRTLTTSSGPTAVQIRQEMDSNSAKLANLDATVSSRLASSAYTAPANSDVAAIKAKTDNLPSDPADQSLLEAAIAGVTAPSAATVASAVRSELSSELSKVSALNTERLANVATTAIVGNLIAQANS